MICLRIGKEGIYVMVDSFALEIIHFILCINKTCLCKDMILSSKRFLWKSNDLNHNELILYTLLV